MTKDTGGQAFPTMHPSGIFDEKLQGMSLRDYFAGQALISLSAQKNENTYKFIAEKCYLYADALLKERSK